MDTLQHTLDSHAIQKQIKIRGRPCPFVNKEIKDMMKFRDILLKRFVQTRDGTDWRNFKQSRDRVKKMLRDAENNIYTFHDVQANKNSPRALWKIINRAVPSKENQQSSYTKDLSTIANEFNLFFSKVGQNAAEASQSLMEKNNITARLRLSDPVQALTLQVFSI